MQLYNKDFIIKSELHQIIEKLALSFSGVLLDYGAGDMPYRELFRKADEYIGADINYWEGRAQFSDIEISNSGKLPISDCTYDGVLCFEVLEHMRDPRVFLAEATRILRPGGKLLITTPFLYGEHGEPHDYFRFTQFGLRFLLEQYGFSVLLIGKTGIKGAYVLHFVAGQVSRLPNFFLLGKALRFVATILINNCYKLLKVLRKEDVSMHREERNYLNLVALAVKQPSLS